MGPWECVFPFQALDCCIVNISMCSIIPLIKHYCFSRQKTFKKKVHSEANGRIYCCWNPETKFPIKNLVTILVIVLFQVFLIVLRNGLKNPQHCRCCCCWWWWWWCRWDKRFRFWSNQRETEDPETDKKLKMNERTGHWRIWEMNLDLKEELRRRL